MTCAKSFMFDSIHKILRG